MEIKRNKRKLTPDEINEIHVRWMLEDADGPETQTLNSGKTMAEDTGKVIYLEEYRRKKSKST